MMINYKLIIKLLGFMLIAESFFMSLGIPFSIYYAERDTKGILISSGITLFSGLIMVLFSRKEKGTLKTREGYATVTLGWILFSAFGALPFVLTNALPTYIDGYFETMSGFTTTGATVINDIENLPHGILFWRSLTHWLGGMGIILLFIAILPFIGAGGTQLYRAEVPGITHDKLTPRVKKTALILWLVYIGLTVAEIVLLIIAGMPAFDSVCHTFGSMATGGFGTKNLSIGYYHSPWIHYIIIVFMYLAGANFAIHYQAIYQKSLKPYLKSNEFVLYTIIILAATLLIFISLMRKNSIDVEQNFRDSLFQVVSIITTTGFITEDYEIWSSFSQFVLILLMFVGGMTGSTGGSIKVVRIFVVFRYIANSLKLHIHPRAVVQVRLDGKTVGKETLHNVIAFFSLFILIYFIGTLLMTMSGLDIHTSVGATIACLGNVGPGLGITGPAHTYFEVSQFGKVILATLMLIGRLELFTVLVLFSRSFWKV